MRVWIQKAATAFDLQERAELQGPCEDGEPGRDRPSPAGGVDKDPEHQQAAAGARWRTRAADQGARVARPKRALRSRPARAQPVTGAAFLTCRPQRGRRWMQQARRLRPAQRRAAQPATARSGGRVAPPIAPLCASAARLRAVAAEQDRSKASGAALRAARESGGRAPVGAPPASGQR